MTKIVTDGNYYRNNLPFGEIEEQSLWVKEGENFILVDDDDFKMVPVQSWAQCFASATLSEQSLKGGES